MRLGLGLGLGLVTSGGAPPFTAADVTSATKRFWHDASDESSITRGAGANVATIVDKFGNAYNPTQATDSARPTLVTDAFGGRQSMRFTAASSQELIFTHASKINDFAGGTDTAYEWWFVLQLNDTTTRIFGCADSSTTQTYALHMTNAADWYYERRDGVGADTFRQQAGAPPVVGTPYVLRCRYGGTSCAWTVNGTTLTTAGSNDTGAMAINRLIYGAYGNGAGAHSSFLDGWIGESMGFTGAVSAGEATPLLAGLKTKWGVA